MYQIYQSLVFTPFLEGNDVRKLEIPPIYLSISRPSTL
jgi:hypothetical protein